jgi:predicted Zn-dependent protease
MPTAVEPMSVDVGAVLEILGAPAHVEVLAQRQELLRFGGSRVTYQHSEESLILRAKLIRQGRAAWGTLGTLNADAVRGLRGRLEAALQHVPLAGEAVLLREPTQDTAARPQTAFEATEGAGAEERVALLVRAREALPSSAILGGSATHVVLDHAVANTSGVQRSERRTKAALQVVATMPDGSSSYAKLVHRDAAALTAEMDPFVERLHDGLAPLPTRGLEPGPCRAVLGPQAMITFVATLGYAAFGARAYHDGMSAVSGRMNDPVVSDPVTLVDDALDDAGLPSSFDGEGAAKRSVALLDEGRVAGVVYDTATARAAGVESTGHAVPPAWRFGAGPSPSHLVMRAGAASDLALLQACGEGLFVQRVDYVRVVHAKQTLVTGTTRDATLWLDRRGRPVARVPQFRFTISLVDLLATVRAVGSRRERGEAVFMESIVAPAALVDAFEVGMITR